MSIKIYNGYRFKENMSLTELNERMRKMRLLFKGVILEEYKRRLINLVYRYADLYVLDPKLCLEELKEFDFSNLIDNSDDPIRSIAANVVMGLRDKAEKAMNPEGKRSSWDYSAEVQILPLEDKILLLFYGSSSLEHIFAEQEDIFDYHYQNQSDQPEDISDEEWEKRYHDWKIALSEWIPAKNGFGVSLFFAEDLPFMPSDVFADGNYKTYQKTLKDRMDQIVEWYCEYPAFTGNNWSVYSEPEYKEFKDQKAMVLMDMFKGKEDPVKRLFSYYSSEGKEQER